MSRAVTNTAIPLSGTIIIMPVFVHEHISLKESVVRLMTKAQELGCPRALTVIHRRLRATDVPPGTVIVTDSFARLTPTPLDTLKWLHSVLNNHVAIHVLDRISLVPGTLAFDTARVLLTSVLASGREHRSMKIRESLHLAKERGTQVGRSALSKEIVEQVLATFDQVGTVRGTARRCKELGIEVSRSAVHRIIRQHRNFAK